MKKLFFDQFHRNPLYVHMECAAAHKSLMGPLGMRRVQSRAALLALLIAGTGILSGCSRPEAGDRQSDPERVSMAEGGSDGASGSAERLCVTTTLFPYYDFVRQVAGDRVKLKLVVPAGMDSHSFEPTPADMIAIQNSDIFLYNGGEMEQWVEDALESIGNPGLCAVSMMDCVDVLEEELVEGMEEGDDHDHGHDHGHDHSEEEPGHIHDGQESEHDHDTYEPGQVREIEYDEHIWTSPVNAMKIVEAICHILVQEDPQHREFYQDNADRYLAELTMLDQEFRQMSSERKRDMIVVGDKFPFRYLAETYDLQYRAAFAGCSSDTEPSARTIAYLIDQVRERQLPAVYYLELSSHRVAEIIGEETGAKPLLLHSCHNVSRQEFDEGVTYLQLMEQNVKNLRAGLVE